MTYDEHVMFQLDLFDLKIRLDNIYTDDGYDMISYLKCSVNGFIDANGLLDEYEEYKENSKRFE